LSHFVIERGDEIKLIHSNIFNKICYEKNIDYKKTELPIHQMSIFEYMEDNHDVNYTYYYYFINTYLNKETPDLFIAFNNELINSINIDDKYIKNNIVKFIEEEWNMKGITKLIFIKENNKLLFTTNDTIQTCHYFYEGKQIFKIIYFYNSIKKYL